MHWTAQLAVVGLLAALVGLGGYALVNGVPERDDRTFFQKWEDETRADRAEVSAAFCAHVRAEVAAGRMSVTPGGHADRTCF